MDTSFSLNKTRSMAALSYYGVTSVGIENAAIWRVDLRVRFLESCYGVSQEHGIEEIISQAEVL